jgi:hypothetical protein
MAKIKKFLRRYTDLPGLIYLLKKRCITLVDPASWDDTNDSHFFTLYRQKENFASVLALCFTQESETYHHWRVFADGASGVCISFHRKELLDAAKKQPGLRARSVRYLKLKEIGAEPLETWELPFIKRYPFEPESEFRLLYATTPKKLETLDIPIPLSCIDRVTLSPWLHKALSPHLKRMLRDIPGCLQLDIARSTLISNEEWKEAGEVATLRPTRRTPKNRPR